MTAIRPGPAAAPPAPPRAGDDCGSLRRGYLQSKDVQGFGAVHISRPAAQPRRAHRDNPRCRG